MKAKRLQIGILIGGLLCAGVAAADPISTLLGMVLMDKVSAPHPEDARPFPWRTMLSHRQLATLESLRHNPVVSACITKADNGNPIAAYQVRKIAAFSNTVKVEMKRSHRAPNLASLRYQRPAMAYAWCARQAGQPTADGETVSLLDYAHRLAALVGDGQRAPTMFAANFSY